MGSETPLLNKLPMLDFSKEELFPGTDNWVSVRAETCKALEEYGCFEAVYDHKFPEELHNVIFGAQMEELFSLPLETKTRNTGDKLYHGYIGNRPHIPLHESMGINDVHIFERIQHFANLMWPQGNDSFCENLHVYMNLVLGLTKMVTRMVFEGYGVEKYYDSHKESITNLLRILKYRTPLVGETNVGGNSHTDKSFITILHQNHVNGLEIQTKSGEWITATPSPNSFIVMIGDAFLAWSNDRLYSPKHQVMMKCDSDTRYSTALFTFSKDIVRVPEELVDEEHPLKFRPFDNMGYVDFYVKPGEQPNAESTIKAYCDDWFSIRIEVIQALEQYGCFEVVYNGVPLELHNDMFCALEKLFDLTTETKSQNISHKSYHGYVGPSSLMPIQESLGIDGAPILERVQDFTKLMWPEGNDSFCETVHSFTTQVLNLTKMVMRIVFESYGVEKYYYSHIESITSLLRLIKYRGPKVNESKLGIISHTDKTFITILHQNQVKGLEVQTKDGEWISVIPSVNSFVVMAGDSFLTWSNARIHSPRHRVMMDGDETRYSTGLFTFSKEIVQAPKELVDEEHPLMYKPFHINDLV